MIILVITNLITLLLLVFCIRKYFGCLHDKQAFQKLMDNVNIGYYRYRYKDGVVLEANKGFTKIIEAEEEPKDIVGRSLSELLIYIDSEGSIRERLKENKHLRNIEYHFKTLKGKDKWVLHNSRIYKDPVGGENVIEVLIEDITEERMSYEKMKESQERYQKLFKNSGDIVIIYSLETGAIEEVNPVTEIITGYSQKELVGSTLESIIHPAHKRALEDARRDLMFTGNASMESVLVCQNGTYREVIVTMSVVDIEGKRIVITILKDISEIMREREEDAKRKKELEEFWQASIKREERIKDLRNELERAQHEIKALRGKR